MEIKFVFEILIKNIVFQDIKIALINMIVFINICNYIFIFFNLILVYFMYFIYIYIYKYI